jgi:hypothetical protein
LIYGLPSFSTEFNHLQPGTILVSSIGKWVGENGFTIFDFGLGSEKYKLRYANKNHMLYRVFASRSRFNILLIKGLLEQNIRGNNFLNNLWENMINLRFRKFINIQKINFDRIKVSFSLFLSAPFFHTKRIIKTRISPNIIYYKFNKENSVNFKEEKHNITIPNLSSILEFANNNPSLNAKSRSTYIKRFHTKNETPFAIVKNNRILQLSWASYEVEDNVKKHANIKQENKVMKIYDCITDIDHRRKGYYKSVLSHIIEHHVNTDIIIYTDDWNTPSQKAISQVGFVQFGIRKGNSNIWKVLR